MAALILGLAVVAVGLYLILRAVDEPAAEEAAEATARPRVTAVPTASPVPTPEPPAVDVTSWELRLVNLDNPLGEDFVPEDLTDVGDNERVDGRVAPALKQLIADARAAGNKVWVCSGYRSYDTQSTIYWNHISQYKSQGLSDEEAKDKTLIAVQYPGCSEHQSGLCVDLLEQNGQPMEPYIAGSGLMLWLEQHCTEYGFVVRYPEDKTSVTGIEYEPWHLRYVGKEAAVYMTEHGLCLEEFLDLYK